MSVDSTKDFRVRREEVIEFIKTELQAQGATPSQTSWATTRIYFWGSTVVDNLYKCIHSDLDKDQIKAIVAHDFNGLSLKDDYFLPKSQQFQEK